MIANQRFLRQIAGLIVFVTTTQFLNCCAKKAEKVTGSAESPAVKFHLSFQSRVGPVKWLQPYTEEKLVDLGKDGVKNLVVVPVSFVSEHIETLEEIDMEYKELAHENGIANW